MKLKMNTRNILIFFASLYFGIFLIHAVGSQSIDRQNLWLPTLYPKDEICHRKGSMVSLPKSKDLSGYKSCFQHLAEVRKTTAHSQHTAEAARERNFNLTTYYNVTTKDGYLLTVFRITGYNNEKLGPKKPAVLLVHPMASSPDIWFYLPGNKSIINKLVNAGFDVFIPAIRGTSYSLGHLSLNASTDHAYWDFSMHEIGIYDLPAVINLMLTETGNKKIFYIGYSLSTNYDAIARAEIPELNDKIHASFWMGTTLFTGYQRSAARLMTYFLGNGQASQLFKRVMNRLVGDRRGFYDEARQTIFFRIWLSSPLACALCGNIFSLATGFDTAQVTYTDLARIIFIVNSYSFKLEMHLAENSRTCRFQKYDYGSRKNYKLYGQSYPPLYNLSNVRSPVYMYYGDDDMAATPSDQRKTLNALPPGTVKGFFRVKWKYFNHFGFLYGNNADILVYDSIVTIIKSYVNN